MKDYKRKHTFKINSTSYLHAVCCAGVFLEQQGYKKAGRVFAVRVPANKLID